MWLTDDDNPATPNDVLIPKLLHSTYSAMYCKQSIIEMLNQLNGNSEQVCANMITEFKEDFEIMTRKLHSCGDTDTVAKMMYLVESFISNYVHPLGEA